MALLRAKIILKEEYMPVEYRHPLECDFYNLMAFITQGNTHVIHTPKLISWNKLPLDSIQIPDKIIMDCYDKKCMMFQTEEEFLKALK